MRPRVPCVSRVCPGSPGVFLPVPVDECDQSKNAKFATAPPILSRSPPRAQAVADSNATIMSGAWPKVLIDRCEINLPYVGELWSTLTALFIVVAGIVPLCTSKYSDEEIDLVNALIVLNGITSALAHSTLLGIFGAADGLSINIGAALYVKAIVLAHHPQIYNSPVQCVLRHLACSQHSLSPYSKLCAIPQ